MSRRIKFTQHAIDRARERGLAKYLDKKKFWFDASPLGVGTVVLDDCIYAYIYRKDRILITTMYRKQLP